MKRTAFLALCSLFISAFSFAQTSVEYFETESHGSSSFTDNGVIFDILSHVGVFDIQGSYPGTGWNGTAIDNRYIDNSGSVANGASFSIKTTSNLFKVNRFWVYLSDHALELNVAGTLTVTGKLGGVTKFTQTKTTGFATSLGATNGYTLIDMTNLNGQNYSNIVIDQLQLTLGGAYTYAGLDAFMWVKDASVILPVSFGTVEAVVKNNQLKVHWETQTETNNDHFNIEASKDGKTFTSIATIQSKAADGNSSQTIRYEWTSGKAFALAALPLIAFVLVSLVSFRCRKTVLLGLALVAGISIATVSCNKSTDEISTSESYYIRIAQVNKDGSTTYSKVVKVVKN